MKSFFFTHLILYSLLVITNFTPMQDDEQAQSFHMEVRSTDKHKCQVLKAILVYSLYPDQNKALTKWIN